MEGKTISKGHRHLENTLKNIFTSKILHQIIWVLEHIIFSTVLHSNRFPPSLERFRIYIKEKNMNNLMFIYRDKLKTLYKFTKLHGTIHTTTSCVSSSVFLSKLRVLNYRIEMVKNLADRRQGRPLPQKTSILTKCLSRRTWYYNRLLPDSFYQSSRTYGRKSPRSISPCHFLTD